MAVRVFKLERLAHVFGCRGHSFRTANCERECMREKYIRDCCPSPWLDVSYTDKKYPLSRRESRWSSFSPAKRSVFVRFRGASRPASRSGGGISGRPSQYMYCPSFGGKFAREGRSCESESRDTDRDTAEECVYMEPPSRDAAEECVGMEPSSLSRDVAKEGVDMETSPSSLSFHSPRQREASREASSDIHPHTDIAEMSESSDSLLSSAASAHMTTSLLSSETTHVVTSLLRSEAALMKTLLLSSKMTQKATSSSAVSRNVEEAAGSPKKKKKKKSLNAEEEVEGSPKKKSSPNAFVAVKMCSTEIASKLKEVQDGMVAANERLSRVLVPIEKSHITLMVLRLDNDEDIERAREALEACAAKSREQFGGCPLSLEVAGLSSFGRRVVFAMVTEGAEKQKLSQLAVQVRSTFEEHGLPSTEPGREFAPHLTVAKVSHGPRGAPKSIDESTYRRFSREKFGMAVVPELELLSMTLPADDDGYYYCLHKSSFT